jgi:hypothetical protein
MAPRQAHGACVTISLTNVIDNDDAEVLRSSPIGGDVKIYHRVADLTTWDQSSGKAGTCFLRVVVVDNIGEACGNANFATTQVSNNMMSSRLRSVWLPGKRTGRVLRQTLSFLRQLHRLMRSEYIPPVAGEYAGKRNLYVSAFQR